ncbi:MAG TPA: glycoside hydrolase family 16 protein [Polyangiaceae bacterium]|jgi:hypothetical protein|nr:glycoside hydrolase family 16 protein [Polyangiaceae bacterium]
MPPMFARSPLGDAALAARSWSTALVLALALTALGCGRENGVVGVAERSSPPGANPTFEDDFRSNVGSWQTRTPLPGASTTFGTSDPDAIDQQVAELVFPGHPEFDSSDGAGADLATQIATERRFHFGTYRTRVEFGPCASNEHVVSAFLGYFSDGSDQNQNGITDDVEIDLQVVCGTPPYLYLTVFTDYQLDAGGTERFRKLSRIVDFSSGDLYDTLAADQDEFSKTGNDPVFSRPSALARSVYHELGFEWHATSLRFFLVLDGSERTLWTLTDPARIPVAPVTVIYNLWHADSAWYPNTGSADFPAHDVTLRVDWFRFYAE